MRVSLINKTLGLLFLMFFIFTVLFPIGYFNKVLFFLLGVVHLVNIKSIKLVTISPIIVLFIFSFGFIVSFINKVDIDLRLQFFFSVLILFLIYPIYKSKINIDFIVKITGIFIIVYTGLAAIIILFNINFPNSDFIKQLYFEYSLGAHGLRDFKFDSITFHIGTVPFLYLSLNLFLISFMQKKSFLKLFVIILTIIVIFLSGSRGLIISSILGVSYIIYVKSKFFFKVIFVGALFITSIFLLIFLIKHTIFFSYNETSNNIKMGHMNSFFNNLNLFNFFVGDGLASIYYTTGLNAYKAHTEITPLDMFRYFGFLLTPVLYYVIVFPINNFKYYLGENKIYVVLFLIYLANSFTNPTFFNSYGLLIVLWYWSKILNKSKKMVNEEIYE